MACAEILRKTAETDIRLRLDTAGGETRVDTGCGFLDHMLTLFARHGGFGLELSCRGDLHVDAHHTTEDVAIVLGRAFDQALGERRGIRRYGSMLLPMDEALILCAVDISGRPCLGWALDIPAARVGEFDTELTKEFFLGFVRALGCCVHLRQLAGENSHHIIEGAFKAFGRAMGQAVSVDPARAGEIPSTKGTIL